MSANLKWTYISDENAHPFIVLLGELVVSSALLAVSDVGFMVLLVVLVEVKHFVIIMVEVSDKAAKRAAFLKSLSWPVLDQGETTDN